MLLNSYIILMKKIWHCLVENAQTEMYPLFYPYIFHEIVSDDLSLFL
jgi:hypothetical protein